jgi:hypothetical protein
VIGLCPPADTPAGNPSTYKGKINAMRTVTQMLSGGAVAVVKGMGLGLKVPLILGIGIGTGAELTQLLNAAWRSSRIVEGNASQADAQSNPDVVKTLVDLKAGKPTPAATATIAVTYAKTEAEARERGAMADAASASEKELLAKQAKGITSTAESLRILELRRARAETETAEAQSTAARAQALAEKQIAEVNSKIIESMNNGSFLDTMIDLSGIRAALPDVPRFSGKRR